MVRRITGVVLALLAVVGFAVAGGKDVTGTVKEVSGGTFVVTDSGGKDWTFGVDSKETLVVVKGGKHKMSALKADGKPTTIGEFVTVKANVVVQYTEKDGKYTAKEVHVK